MYFKTVKELYVIQNRNGEVVQLNSKRFCWNSLGAANRALAKHIENTVFFMPRDVSKIENAVNNNHLVRCFDPTEYFYKIDGVMVTSNSIKEVREKILTTGLLKIVKI